MPPVHTTVKSYGVNEEDDIITGCTGIAASVETHVESDDTIPPVFEACIINWNAVADDKLLN